MKRNLSIVLIFFIALTSIYLYIRGNSSLDEVIDTGQTPQSVLEEIDSNSQHASEDEQQVPPTSSEIPKNIQEIQEDQEVQAQLRSMVISKNTRHKITNVVIDRIIDKENIEITYVTVHNNLEYFKKAIVDRTTGEIIRTWGNTRYENTPYLEVPNNR